MNSIHKQRDLKVINALARSMGLKSSVKNLVIRINDEPFGYNQINSLPHGLSLEKAKTQHTPDGIAFQSEHAPFSNLFRCNVPYANHYYDSVERAYQHQLALECQQFDLADDILAAKSPLDCLYAAKDLKKSRQIVDSEIVLMEELLEVKFTADPNLNTYLLNSEGKFLYEATFDRKWGCQYHLGQRDEITQANVTRGNLLGKTLEKLRLKLLRAAAGEDVQSVGDPWTSPATDAQQAAFWNPANLNRSHSSPHSSHVGSNESLATTQAPLNQDQQQQQQPQFLTTAPNQGQQQQQQPQHPAQIPTVPPPQSQQQQLMPTLQTQQQPLPDQQTTPPR